MEIVTSEATPTVMTEVESTPFRIYKEECKGTNCDGYRGRQTETQKGLTCK